MRYKQLKFIATILNILLLIIVIYLVITRGWPKSEDIVIFILLFTAPLANLWLIVFSTNSSKNKKFISLYFERRALEEQKKIDELNQK